MAAVPRPLGFGASSRVRWASAVNGGIDAFVRAAAIELPRQLRINAVSATVLEEAWDAYEPYFPGYIPVPAAASRSGAKIGCVQQGFLVAVGDRWSVVRTLTAKPAAPAGTAGPYGRGPDRQVT